SIASAQAGTITFGGLFSDELRNVTFAGERDAAVTEFVAYGRFQAIDRQIRSLEQAGKHQDAVALCTGYEEGQSNWAFVRFDSALGKTLDINQTAFDRAIDAGFDAMRPYTLAGPLVALTIAVLVWLGLRPRMNEYRV